MNFGERIAKWRVLWGLSQRELARRADITNGALSQIEQGNTSPQVATLEKIAKALSVSLDVLMFKEPFAPSQLVTEGDCNLLPLSRGRLSRYQLDDRVLLRFALPINTHVEMASLPESGHSNALTSSQLFLYAGELSVKCASASHHLLAGDALQVNMPQETSFSTGTEQGAEFVLFS